MKVLGKKALSGVLSFSILISPLFIPSSPASADTGTVSDSFVSSWEKQEFQEQVKGSDRTEAIKKAEAAFSNKAVLNPGEKIAPASSVLKLDNGALLVSAPIEGAAPGSVIGAQIGAKGQVSTFQISLQEIDQSSGTLTTYQDGKLQIDHQKVEATPSTEQPTPGTPKGLHWGEFNRCLSNAGIASWAITALSIACGVACAATAGTGCFACLVAASGATGGVVGFCARSAWH